MFVTLKAYIRKKKRSQIIDLNFDLTKLEKEEKTNTKQAEERNEYRLHGKLMKQNTENQREISMDKSSFFDSINKMDKPLPKMSS